MRNRNRRLAAILSVSVVGAASAARADVFSNVPSLNGYSVVYDQQIARYAGQSNFVGGTPYAGDFSAAYAAGSFSRVGYYLELQANTVGAPLTYAYAEFDALGFTNDPTRIGIPTSAANTVFQQNVANMRVVSNVAGVANGTNIQTGNIEFWPHNYAPANGAAVPNASAATFDFGDTRDANVPQGHGSMQIHNYNYNGANQGQTIIGYNRWGNAGQAANNAGPTAQLDLGIGNATSGQPDWTSNSNAGSYSVKNLQVVVNAARPKPALSLNSPVPAAIAANVPAAETNGYQLVYESNLPTSGAFAAANYATNNAALVAPGSFGRVAYYLELRDNVAGTTKWTWISADAFTASAGKIGVPLASTGAMFQGALKNAKVYASGNTGITGGPNVGTANIEFWPTNYTQIDQLPIAGSSDTVYDEGDEITPGNYGSMQMHADGKTIFAFNHWGGSAGTNDLGIGDSAVGSPDYTQTATGSLYATAGSYAKLYVFVSAVPEPSTLGLLAIGTGMLLGRRRRTRVG